MDITGTLFRTLIFFPPRSQNIQKTFAVDRQLKDAIFDGDIDKVIQILADHGSQILSSPLSDGELPLHAAVRLKREAIVRLFVNNRVDIYQRDFQDVSALEYASAVRDIEMLRILLPSAFVNDMDNIQKHVNALNFENDIQVQKMAALILTVQSRVDMIEQLGELATAIVKGQLGVVERLLDDVNEVSSQHLFLAMLKGHEHILLLLIPKVKNYNLCVSNGISPLHIAVALNRTSALEMMLQEGANLFEKNSAGVAPANLLFREAKSNDPLRLQKAQLLLGLLSLGVILADKLLFPSLEKEKVALLQGGMALLQIGSELALSYHAYLQIMPENLTGKILYWTTALGTLHITGLINRIPSARVLWSSWRSASICRRAWTQVNLAYKNFYYDPKRSLHKAAIQLLAAGTSIYNTQQTIREIFNVKSMKEEVEKEHTDLQAEKVALKKSKDELAKKEREFTKREKAFTKLENDWTENAKQETVCREVLSNDIEKYKAGFYDRAAHPNLPYLLDSARTPETSIEDAICIIFGSEINSGKLKSHELDEAKIKVQYRDLGKKFHPDQCKRYILDELICLTVDARINLAKEKLFNNIAKIPSNVVCSQPKVIQWVMGEGHKRGFYEVLSGKFF